jgi:hypothetical protein
VMPMRPSFLISMWIPIRRYEREYPGELSAEPAEDAADGRRRYPDLRGDLLARVALPPQRLDRGTFGGWGWLGKDWDREERSRRSWRLDLFGVRGAFL